MYLAYKSNEEIDNEVTRIAREETTLGIECILYLCGVMRRNLHLAGQHASLFSYLVGKGYTRDQALVRKDAVMLLIELPELKSAFVNRLFNMSTLHYVRQVFRREDRRRKKLKLDTLTRERKLEVTRM